MSLTAYVGHIAVIAILGGQRVGEFPVIVYTALVAGTVLTCALWPQFLGRGRWIIFCTR